MGEIINYLSISKKLENVPEYIKNPEKRIDLLKEALGQSFDCYDEGSKRIKTYLFIFSKNFIPQLKDTEGKHLLESLKQCSAIESRQEFIEKIFSLAKPFISQQANEPWLMEIAKRNYFARKNELLPLNEIMFWKLDNKNTASIHLGEAKTFNPIEIKQLALEGLKNLAKTVRENKDIEKITATSWIVTKHPKLIELLGFTIKKRSYLSQGVRKIEIAKKNLLKDKHNPKTVQASPSIISRENFLKKYLDK